MVRCLWFQQVLEIAVAPMSSGDLDGRGPDGRRGSGMAILPDLRPPVVVSAPVALVIFVVVAALVPTVPVVL